MKEKMRTVGLSALLMLVLGFVSSVYAQPNLNFKRITVNWPTIELYFQVGCNGLPSYNLNKADFKIFENGVEVKDFTLWCPDPTVRCAISVSLVFDESGSMAGGGISGEIAAGHAFIDMMDGVIDEAAIIGFDQMVYNVCEMTTLKPVLNSAIDGLSAMGATAVWNGIYAGLEELIANGQNQCRAVIVLTDGGDNSSTRNPAEVIALANRYRIRIFTIGLGSSVDAALLESIALQTGGKFYLAPSPGELAAIYQEISTIMFQGFQECVITYQSKCMDGSTRTVDLQLLNFCGGSDSKTKIYRAPKDTTTFSPLVLKLDKKQARGNTLVKMPLQLVTPINNEYLYPASFALLFDQTCCQFVSIATPPGTLLSGVPITATPIPGGMSFYITQRTMINGNGPLAEFTFRTSDPLKDTVCCPIALANWQFTAGCFRPILDTGQICIIPRKPDVICRIDGPPELVWQRAIKDYVPNPFVVTMRITNNGDREATNTRYKITYPKADLTLVSPLSDTQNGTPRDLPPAESAEGSWTLAAKRRTTGDSLQICITASFDNQKDVQCCYKVWVPPTEPILSCSVSTPIITADNANLKYVPMPFQVNVSVLNDGGMKTDSVWATIIVPPDLSLAGVDAPNKNTKKVLPSILPPNGTGVVSWTVKHPITMVQKSYTIQVWVKTSNADSSLCEGTVIIPKLDAPILQPRCYSSAPGDSLHFDDNLDAYVPNPFTMRLTCVNTGSTAASNVSGQIFLPPDVVFNPPGQSPLKFFTPSTMQPYKPGDPVPELTWTVEYTKRYRKETTQDFQFKVGGLGITGIPTDTADVWCSVRVPGLEPLLSCTLTIPDSLGLNANGNGNTPNPFQVTYTITNQSKQTAYVRNLSLADLTADGIRFDATDTMKAWGKSWGAPGMMIGKGETRSFTWTLYALPRLVQRNVHIVVYALDDEGNQVLCEDYLPITPIPTALMCNLETSEPVLKYQQKTKDYSPDKFTLTCTLTNSGGANLDNLTANLVIEDTLGLVEFDPAFADNTNPKTWPLLFPATNQTFTWGLRMAKKNVSDVLQTVRFSIAYGSDQTPKFDAFTGCDVNVDIQPVVNPQLVCTLQAPDTIFFDVNKYNPSPYHVRLKVDNIGTGTAENVQAYLLQNTRFNIIPPTFLNLPDIPSMGSVDFLSNAGYDLTVNARQTDGYDTIRVVVQADGIPSYTCMYPIFVQRERRPDFQMQCSTQDVIKFDDQLNDYVPNPITITTMVVNIGDTKADECKLVFVGPPRFMPFDNVSIKDIGTMQVGDTAYLTWQLIPLRRDVGGTESITFQIQGKGGLGNRVVIGECKVDIYVPPARSAEYSCVVTAPDKIVFDPGNGTYQPDPFTYSVTVTNIGLADGMGLTATIQLPPGMTLATTVPPQSATIAMPDLPVGMTSAPLTWLVRPIARKDNADLTVSVEIKDRFGKTKDCPKVITVPPAPDPGLSIVCDAELKTLVVDKQRGQYVQGTFWVGATVTNSSGRPVNNVYLVVLPQLNDLKVVGDPQQLVALKLDPNVTTQMIQWTLNAIPRSQSGYIEVKFIVSGDGIPSQECSVMIYVPEVGRPKLTCMAPPAGTSYFSVGDTLHFDFNQGDYQGFKSTRGNYTVFTLAPKVENFSGFAQATGVKATLLLPNGVTLDEGEEAIKYVSPSDILIGNFSGVSWNIRPVRQDVGTLRTFTVNYTSDNADPLTCTYDLFIQGAPKVVDLSLPDDPVGSFGDKITVPVYIGQTIGRDVNSYKLNVQFDPNAVRFIDAITTNSLTERGWNGPRTQLFNIPDGSGTLLPNVLRIEDYTTGTPLGTSKTGSLVYLVFEAVEGGSGREFNVLPSDLKFVRTMTVDIGGTPTVMLSSMNSTEDGLPGDVTLNTKDGHITVSGECIIPLASTTYSLGQNKPNPFNPTTTIAYELGEETDFSLTVFDQLGREVLTLAKGHARAGKYSVVFDGRDLSSGIYMYKLETPKFTKVMRMVLER